MNRFIEVTKNAHNESHQIKISVSVHAIISIRDSQKGAVIHLSNGDVMTVQETYQEVLALAAQSP